MTNYEFLKSGEVTVRDFIRFFGDTCETCIYCGLFDGCHEASVTCYEGRRLWLLANHKEEEKKND